MPDHFFKNVDILKLLLVPVMWASLTAQLVRICLQCRRPWFDSWVGKIHWRRDKLPTPVFLGFLGGSAGKESACKAGDLGLIPGLGRFPGKGKGYPLQYSGVENSMNCIGSQRVGHDWATFTSQTPGWNWHRCQKQKKVILVSLLE